ncbi:MAG: hypothetical protein R2778_09575 [Saprospiraceae bacterium]
MSSSTYGNRIERAQKKVEENNFGIRKRLLEYDDVMNIQREAIYRKRRNALFGNAFRWISTMHLFPLLLNWCTYTGMPAISRRSAWIVSDSLA